MTDRTTIAAAIIVGGAIVAASFQTRPRFLISAANSNVAWRMDTWSGQIDICGATYVGGAPIVRCGVMVVVPNPDTAPDQAPAPAKPNAAEPPAPFAAPPGQPRDQA